MVAGVVWAGKLPVSWGFDKMLRWIKEHTLAIPAIWEVEAAGLQVPVQAHLVST